MKIINIYYIIITISFTISKNYRNYLNKTNHISLHFNRKIDDGNFFEQNQKNNLFTQIKLGSKSQYTSLLISFSSKIFCFLNNKNSDSIKLSYYIEDYTSTTKLREEFNEKENNIKGYNLHHDLILVDGTKIKHLNFIYGITNKEINFNGKLGLKLSLIMEKNRDYDSYGKENYEELKEKSNFLMQLMYRHLIYDYIYTIHYTNKKYGEEKGIIYFGALPHKFLPEKYDFNNYFSFSAFYQNINTLTNYTTYFKKIFYGEEKINIKYIKFDVEYGLMNAPMFFKDFIQKDLLDNNNNKCYSYIKNNYSYFYCDKDAEISKIKPIKFYVDRTHFFVFNNKDMFIHKDNKLYFIFGFSFYVNYWRFGTPFFKKYEIVFEHEDKKIGCYFNNIIEPINNDIKKDFPTNNKEGYFKKILVIIIVTAFVIIDLLLYFYCRCRNKIKFQFRKREKLIELKQCNEKCEIGDNEKTAENE